METAKASDREIFTALSERFPGLDNNGRPKSEYFNRLLSMDAKALKKETKDKIWLSAFASNNPRSDYHWQADACFAAYAMRGNEKGYTQAYREVFLSEAGHDPYPDIPWEDSDDE